MSFMDGRRINVRKIMFIGVCVGVGCLLLEASHLDNVGMFEE
jgi:hypothetical protein